MTAATVSYPLQLDVAPPAPQSRLTVFFRIIMVIPHVIVLAFLILAAVVVTFIAWLAILVTGSYPAGMLNFSVGVQRWSNRVNGYVMLLTDAYPPFSMEPADSYPIVFRADVHPGSRNRLTTFFRIFMVLPHFIILGVLGTVIRVIVFIAWVVALLTGKVPAGLHDFLAGYLRWQARAGGYAMLLCDEYPPFGFN